jgi:glutamate dehydrogenase/leucine dehydrogenase
LLAEHGAVLVAASDTGGTVSRGGGLDIAKLHAAKQEGGSVTDAGQGESGDRDAVIGADCDIWIPAARPDVIHAGNVERLKAKLVLQGANIPITHDAEATLAARGVLVIPDFIANAGGVICAAVEYAGGTETSAKRTIEEKIRRNTRDVLVRVKEDGVLPRQAAVDMASERVHAAMTYRRDA